MIEKGYPFPLYSLQLGHPADAYHFIRTTHGPLVAAPPLLRRAMAIRSAACQIAVATVLEAQQQHSEVLGRRGLTEAWARSLAYWAERLAACEQARAANLRERQQTQEDVLGQVERGRELWHAVVVLSRLAGVVGITTGVAVPREPQALGEALRGLEERIAPPALLARLQANGLDEGLRAEMAQLSAVLSRVGEVREQNAERNRCIAGELLVIRAGLFGDLSRFSQIAAITVPRPHAAPLKLQNLLPLWRRSSPGVRDVPSEALPPRG